MRRSAFALVASATLAALLAVPALADTVVRHDADDFEIAPDVHSTAKHTIPAADGNGWRLRISVTGELGPRYQVRVRLDTRGGPKAEYVMAAIVRRLELVSCFARRLEGPFIRTNCDADPFRVWWGVSRRDLHRDKAIRWRVVASGGPDVNTVTDRAPDLGWYP